MAERTPYDMICQAWEEDPQNAPKPMHNVSDGIAEDEQGRRRIVHGTKALDNYMQRADDQVAKLGKDRPLFTFCRRLAKTAVEEIGPDDRIDRCAICKCRVLFNIRHSKGIPHLCAPCFTYNASESLREMLAPAPQEFSEQTDAELCRWMYTRCGTTPGKFEPEDRDKRGT